jgi:TPR repeat protein
MAEQGDAEAQNNLGLSYVSGQGMAQDYQQAVAWFRKATDQGEAEAQFHLANSYAEGQGGAQDYQQAVRWFGFARPLNKAMPRPKAPLASSTVAARARQH